MQFNVGEGRAHRSPTAGGTGMLILVDPKSPVTNLGRDKREEGKIQEQFREGRKNRWILARRAAPVEKF